jgi:hypothetical protein
MPAPYQRAGLFWCAFLPNAPRRYAVTLTLNQDQHHDRKDDRSSQLSSDRYAMYGRKAALPVFGIGSDSTRQQCCADSPTRTNRSRASI